tara:strand:+ start:1693 stop:1980 length:288 start_codon:yes stop_codon:yes gene_type:complete
MAITLSDDQGTSYTSAAAFSDKTRRAEFWGVDDESAATAHEAIWVQIADPAGVTADIKIPAGETWYIEFPAGTADNWTWAVKADSGTTDIYTVET